MICRRSTIAIALGVGLMFGACAEAFAQTANPSEIIQRAARTRVSNARKAPRPANQHTTPPVVATKQNLVPTIASQTPVTSDVGANQPSASQSKDEPVTPSGSGMSVILIGVAVVASFAGTIVLLAFIQRVLQPRTQPQRSPVVIATPMPQAEHRARTAMPAADATPLDEELETESRDFGFRYQPGTGEMELAMAIERLKRELPIPSAPRRKKALPKTRSGRIAAARKMGKGSGELELAARLEQLRAASAAAQEGV